jgi:arylsulfatase
MATCVDLARTEYPEQWNGNAITPLQGQSLKPLLTGEGEFTTRPLHWEHEGNAAIRVGDRKLVRQGMRGAWELFDLQSDRTEQHNLAEAHPTQVDRLAKQWESWARSANVIPKPPPKKRSSSRKEPRKERS